MPVDHRANRSGAITSIAELVDSIGINVLATTQASRFKAMYKNDRIAFVHDIMPDYGKSITPYQEAILGYMDGGHNRVAVRGPHGLGKTFLASIIIHHGVLTADSDCKVPTTASVWRQLEKYLWPEVWKSSGRIAWPKVGRGPYDTKTELLQQEIKLRELDVSAFAMASDDHTALEGAHASIMRVVFDEAKTIAVPTWDALEGAFSNEGIHGADVSAFAISTPGDPSGRFYDIHTRKPGYADWLAIHVTIDQAIDAGRISKLWVENRRKQWGEESSVFQNRVLGEFAENSEDSVIPLAWVKLSNDRWNAWMASGKPTTGAQRALGVDVARLGQDATVLAWLHGLAIQEMHTIRKVPLTAVAGHVQRWATLYEYPSVNIEMEGGYGSSVYDMLHEQEFPNLHPVNVSHKTFKRTRDGTMGFSNVRSAMWWNIREHLDPINGSGLMLPPVQELTTDLTAPGWDITSNGNIQVWKKELIMEKIGRSPDYGTAVALALWNSSSGGGIVF